MIFLTKSKWLIVYSSATGNTQKVAEAIYSGFEHGEADIYSIKDSDKFNLDDYDNIAVGYWLTRGGPDKTVQELLSKLHHKQVVLFQTHGTEVGSEHCFTAFARAATYLNSDCKVLATFTCQGRINPALLAKRFNGDVNDPHTASTRNKARWASAANHPNEEDLNRAKELVNVIKHKLALRQKYLNK